MNHLGNAIVKYSRRCRDPLHRLEAFRASEQVQPRCISDASMLSTVRRFASSLATDEKESLDEHSDQSFTRLVNSPPVQFGTGKVARLTESSVIGSSGQTVVLTTMAAAALEDSLKEKSSSESKSVAEYLRQFCKQTSFVPLTVDYRQRHHAVGKIPTTANRSDNRAPTPAETLASRAIDRALRPLLHSSGDSIHVQCSVQACPVADGTGGNPISLALNSASAVLQHRLQGPVACVYLILLKDGTVVLDPAKPDKNAVCELLYAGTRSEVVMMEFSGILPESKLEDLIKLAHSCIQPLLDIQREIHMETQEESLSEDMLRKELGLPVTSSPATNENSTDSDNEKIAREIFEEALLFCKKELSEASLKLFGARDPQESVSGSASEDSKIHPKHASPLLSKSHRGRREALFQDAIRTLLDDFTPSSSLKDEFENLKEENPSIIQLLAESMHSQMLQEALGNAAIKHGRRGDERGTDSQDACRTIRPLSIDCPALPNTVHGSSLFTRGETQVLCTATLGPPKDGILLNDPFTPSSEDLVQEEKRPSDDLPVGSLRYLRTQEYLESDLNSRKVRADREQTGDSGVLKERRRAFLQYDFPAYSKGEVQSGPAGRANRREIGHGALAEKAILPILPEASDFPYAIRMTSEVTSSNGSSSMASVCGATLALLDAGVPIKAPVAGVSVGLAKGSNLNDDYKLLLDITGTEDHYGAMDFKIAGTKDAVTAVHLDVHEPLPHSVVFQALALANNARAVMIDEMASQAARSSDGAIQELSPRAELKPSAPRVEVVRFDPMRKKDLLGPGGAVIRQMEDRFNVSLDLTQEGQCLLFGDDRQMVRKAKVAVMDLVSDVEVGQVYEGTVIEIRDFGVIIELLRNKEGLCHVSELANQKEIKEHPEGTTGLINSILHVGQKLDVECTAVDPVMGTIRVRPARKDSKR